MKAGYLLTFKLLNLREPKLLTTFKQLAELESELFERYLSGCISRDNYDHLWGQVNKRFAQVPNA